MFHPIFLYTSTTVEITIGYLTESHVLSDDLAQSTTVEITIGYLTVGF